MLMSTPTTAPVGSDSQLPMHKMILTEQGGLDLKSLVAGGLRGIPLKPTNQFRRFHIDLVKGRSHTIQEVLHHRRVSLTRRRTGDGEVSGQETAAV